MSVTSCAWGKVCGVRGTPGMMIADSNVSLRPAINVVTGRMATEKAEILGWKNRNQ